MKRAFIVHGWGGTVREGWFPWLKSELEKNGFIVQIPPMPNPDQPTIKEWTEHLTKVVGTPDEETFLIGHSIGCQTIIRYVETLDRRIGGAVFVAGFFTLSGIDADEERKLARPWLEEPIDVKRVKRNLKGSVAILSTNDEYVPFVENRTMFEGRLGSEIVVEKDKGHLGGEARIKILPSALDAVLRLAV